VSGKILKGMLIALLTGCLMACDTIPNNAPVSEVNAATHRTPSLQVANWIMPTKGQAVRADHGVNIFGHTGQSIYAARSGQVVYSGNGLHGLGNLIILKHADGYFTAYAHNLTVYVEVGESVKQGQEIAEMGTTDAGIPMLYFEIRRGNKPILF
jgi:lipoprotein NlpD